jgi:hypothetical protein
VLDGAVLAAQSVGASEVILYVGAGFEAAWAAAETALRERSADRPGRRRAGRAACGRGWSPRRPGTLRVRSPPPWPCSTGRGEPAVTPPRPFERGVGGPPAPAAAPPGGRAGTGRRRRWFSKGGRRPGLAMSHRLGVDPIRCDGHGLCAELFPDRVRADD